MLQIKALAPTAVLFAPVVLSLKANTPKAVLRVPVALHVKALVPIPILLEAVLQRSASTPIAMLYDPADHFEPEETKADFKQNSKLYERFMKIKQSSLLSIFRKKEGGLSAKSLLKIFFT